MAIGISEVFVTSLKNAPRSLIRPQFAAMMSSEDTVKATMTAHSPGGLDDCRPERRLGEVSVIEKRLG